MPEDSYVQNGSLWLRCRKATGSEFGGYPYSEGFVHTDGKKNYTYGYVEIRARFPAGRGVWPAFWTLSWGWPKLPEHIKAAIKALTEPFKKRNEL
jgi:beta-glucanase (GH16 family)